MNDNPLHNQSNETSEKGSERRSANWDIQNIFKNYFALLGGQIGSVIFSFASVFLATFYFGTDGYGSIVAVIAASHTIQIFVSWTNVALARFGVEEFVEDGEITRSFWGRGSLLATNVLLILLTSPLWIGFLTGWMKLPEGTSLLIIAHFLTFAVWLHVQNALQAAKLLKLQNILLAIERGLIFCSLLIAGMLPNITWLEALYIYIFSPWIVILIGLWQVKSFIVWRFTFDKAWVRKIIKFSLPLIPFTTIGYFSTHYLDSFFIAQYLSKADLGVYSIAYQVNGMMMQVPMLMGVLLMPMFVTLQTKKEDTQVKSYMQKVLPLMTLLWGICSALIAISAIILLPLIFNVDKEQIIPILWIFIVGSTFAFPQFAGYAPFANAVSATYISSFMGITVAITNLLGNMFLIPRYELIGAAIATILSFIFGTLIVAILLHRHSSLQHEWLWQTTIPALLGIIYYCWSFDILQSVGILLLATLIIAVIYRRSLIGSIETFKAMRAKFSVAG